MSRDPDNGGGVWSGRKRARRTAWVLAAIVLAVYVGYLAYLALAGPGA